MNDIEFTECSGQNLKGDAMRVSFAVAANALLPVTVVLVALMPGGVPAWNSMTGYFGGRVKHSEDRT